MDENQFDTIYHEHFSYFSFLTTGEDFCGAWLAGFRRRRIAHPRRIAADLRLPRGRRIQARWPARDRACARSRNRSGLRSRWRRYRRLCRASVKETKRALLEFLIAAKSEGKASPDTALPGKGNTLLNYCGIRTDFLDYTVDRNPYKQGKFLPGTHIPIYAPERIEKPSRIISLFFRGI